MAFFAVASFAVEPDVLAADTLLQTPDVPAGDSLGQSPEGLAAEKNVDSLVFSPEILAEGNAVDSIGNLSKETRPDSTQSTVIPKDTTAPQVPVKSVLYLGGGEHSPWFFLGVLYAIEEYGIPVDSVVGTSWGAWIGALWSRGVPVDDIQRIMLDPAVESYVGKDLTQEPILSRRPQDISLSLGGVPSLRQRFTLHTDSAGRTQRHLKSLEVDSSYIRRSLARLRIQETLYRQRSHEIVPFAVQTCDGLAGNSTEAVVASLPLWTSLVQGATQDKNAQIPKTSGELCPHLAMPLEDRPHELSLIAVAEPLRGELQGDERKQLLVQQAMTSLGTQPGVIFRAHTVLDTARKSWIQAGFTAVERKLKDLEPLSSRRVDYSSQKQVAPLPWFRFTPSFDDVSAELHSSVKSRWAESDTGLTAPLNFALSLSEHPAYDSVYFDMQPNGELLLGTAVHPTFDLAAGGFGSNGIGPNGYLEATLNYVNQMEILLVLKGFWGNSSYGFQPRLDVARLWNKHWAVQFGYDMLTLAPLKSFRNALDPAYRITREKRNDFSMSILYRLNQEQFVSLDFLFGHRSFEMEPSLYGKDDIETYPISPMLHYNFSRGGSNKWFSLGGFALDARGGLESIGFDFGINDVIPIYWKFILDARYSASPRNFATFTAGASAGIQRYHEDGYGYVSPKSFGYAPLDLIYRLHGEATPWSSQWKDPELASHEYGLLRGSASLHGDYLGAWVFVAYFHDFEENPYSKWGENKFILEPAIRFHYKSLDIYVGLNRVVDKDNLKLLKEFKDYNYFIRVGEYSF